MSLKHIVPKRKRQRRKGKTQEMVRHKSKHHRLSSEYNLSINRSTDRRFQHIKYKGSLMSVSCLRECSMKEGSFFLTGERQLTHGGVWKQHITPGNLHRHGWLLQKSPVPVSSHSGGPVRNSPLTQNPSPQTIPNSKVKTAISGGAAWQILGWQSDQGFYPRDGMGWLHIPLLWETENGVLFCNILAGSQDLSFKGRTRDCLKVSFIKRDHRFY